MRIMGGRGGRAAAALGLVGLLVVTTAGVSAGGAPGGDEVVPVTGHDLDGPAPERTRDPDGPSSSALRRAAARRGPGSEVVEVHHHGDRDVAEALVVAAGGRVHGPAGDRAVEATVPVAAVAGIEASPAVAYVTTPTLASPAAEQSPAGTAVTGAQVGITRANQWHAAGLRGAGVKVGIIDTFSGGAWYRSAGAGDVPTAAETFCRRAGSSCSVWDGGSAHGVAVAEVVHEMAPQATLYLAEVWTTADLQAAITWFHSQGVRIMTRSETAEYDGPGNGTGGLANVIDDAVSRGMVFVSSAGNNAGDSGRRGSYWRGPWSDPDGDGWLNFSGNDEMLTTTCWFFNGLRWDDWGANRTDYDVYLWDEDGDLIGWNDDDQRAGAPPIERMNRIPCEPYETVYISVYAHHPGNGTADDTLEIMVNGMGLEHWSNPHAAAAPMVDSANPGMLAVGAVDPAGGTAIARYSSHGPTNDGRIKPDLSAPSCVATTAYAPGCFNGTSAAAPAVAGALALARQAGVATTPAGLAGWARGATVDGGAPGPDTVFGAGVLRLPVASAAPFATPAALVDRQFRDLVGRPPTASERTTWLPRILLGTHSRADLVASLRASHENRTNVDPVARLYRAYFLRIPDRPGLQHWIARKRGGTSLNQISQSFAASVEFRTRYGALTDRQFVDRIYQNVLGRPGEASGVAFWTGELTSRRRTRGQVMVGFSESSEYRTRQARSVDVSVIVIALLRRAPTPAEHATLLAGPATPVALAEYAFTHPDYAAG